MDQDIRDALTDLRADVRTGFSDINKRIDALVSRTEFAATVERLDAQHAALRKDFDAHEEASLSHVAEVRNADDIVLTKAQAMSAAIREELHKELQGFRTTTRWAIGISVTSAGFLVTVIWMIVQYVQSAQ